MISRGGCRLAHDVLYIVKQRVSQMADIHAFTLHVRREHHEFADPHLVIADHTFQGTGFIASAAGVLCPFHHRHLAIGLYTLWAFCGIGGLPHIGVRNGHGSAGCGRLADVRKDDTDSVTAFVDYAPAIGKGGLGHHTLLMIHRFWLYSDGSLYTSFCFGAVPQIKKFNSLIQLPAAVD